MTADSSTANIATSPSRTKMIIYFGVLIVTFMATFDRQIVVTALPTIASELDRLDLFGWVGSSYLLAAAVSPFYGKLGDTFGRKPIIITAIILFLLGSLLCGLVPSMERLVAARVLQGLGGGGLMVSTFAVIGELFSASERAKYQGYSGAGCLCRPCSARWPATAIAGLFGRRWAFLINVPIGIAVIIAIAPVMPSKFNECRCKIDYPSGVLLAIAATTLIYLVRLPCLARRHRSLALAAFVEARTISTGLSIRIVSHLFPRPLQ